MRYLLFIISSVLFAAPPKTPPPVSIKIATVKPEIIETQDYFLGSISSVNSSVLSLERSGVVVKIFAKDNSYVHKGDPILQINSEVISANLESAAANLKLAVTEKERLKNLYFSKAISAAHYDQAINNFKVAQANYLLYKAQLDQTILKAPFSGYIGFVKYGVGEFLSAGAPITNINNLKKLQVTFFVPQEMLSELKDVSQIKLIDRKNTYSVENINVETFIDPNTRMSKVISKIEKNNKLLPGAFVKVILRKKTSKLMLPESSVSYNVDGAYIYKFKHENPIKTPVEVGLHYQDKVIIKSGLSAGEQVVVAGQFKLYPNAPIVIVK